MVNRINIMLLPTNYISENIVRKLHEKDVYFYGTSLNALTNQTLIDWLRIQKNIHVDIGWLHNENGGAMWYFHVSKINITNDSIFEVRDDLSPLYQFNTYEECRDAAILAALELV